MADLQWLYWLQHVATAIALGTAAISYGGRFTRLALIPRLLFGVALTPAFLGVTVLVIAALAPGTSPFTFLAVPLLFSSIVVFLLGPGSWAQVHQHTRHFRTIQLTPFLAIVAILALAGFKVFEAAQTMLVAHDASVYLAEARSFSAVRAISAIPGYDSQPGTVLRIHPHSFLFQAYLAQAEMSLPADKAVDAFTPKFSIGLTYLYLGISIWALAAVAAPTWVAGLALPILLCLPTFGSLVFLHSRDAFRMLPFTALIAVLLPMFGRNRTLARAQCVCVGVLVALTIGGHTINIVFLAAVWAGLTLLCLVGSLPSRSLWLVTLAGAAGSVLPGVDYVRSTYVYGSPLGLGMNYLFYSGTPLATWFRSAAHWSSEAGIFDGLAIYAQTYGLTLTILAALAGLAGAALAGRRRPRWQALGVCFLAILLLPLFASMGKVSVRGALLSNLRYASGIYFLAAPVIVTAIAYSIKAIGTRIGHHRSWLLKLGLSATASLVVMIVAVPHVRSWMTDIEPSWLEAVAAEYAVAASAVRESVGPDGSWLTDDYRLAYRISPAPTYLFSKQGQPLLQAKSADEARRVIVSLRLCAILLSKPDKQQAAAGWPNDMAFMKLVRSQSGSVERENGRMLIYRLGADLYNDVGVPSPCP